MNEKSAIRIFSIIIFISAVMILTATVLFIVHERKAYYLKVDGMDKSAASVTAAPAVVESKIPEKKEEEKLETAPFPAAHAALYNVVQEEVPDIYQSIANDIECSSLFKTLDNRLSKCITENALTVHVKAQHQQQYGTVVKVEKYGKDGKNFATDKTILLLNENIPDGESADLTIYPTAMITQDNDQTLEIFALNPLAAYKACMEGIDRQLDGAYYILDLHLEAKRNEELAQQSRALAEQALQEAENARLQAQKEAETGYSRLIRDTIQFVEEHCSEQELSVNDIAKGMNFSAAHLNVLFRKETGITIKQYISDYRLHLSKKLLRNEHMKIVEIAERCGYSNANYFAKVFRNAEGMSPLEYRQKENGSRSE